ncbi:MAG: hypothetical protein WBA74_27350 [Cyclobacteriaceae bacterium]
MKYILLLPVFLLIASATYAQEENLQTYTPSILFDKGDYEFKSFQNYYWQNSNFTGTFSSSDKGENQVFFTSINQFLYGLNSKVNIGFDVWVKHTDLPFQGDRANQTGVSLFGPKIKVAPFKGLERLSIQTAYLFSTIDDQENRLPDSDLPGFFFSNDRDIWLTQFFYDLPVSDQFQLFFQQAFWYSNVDDSFLRNNYLETQSSVFFSYFATDRWTIYGMTEYFPRHYSFETQSSEFANSWFVQSGLGLKYQLIPGLIELEALYTDFWAGSVGQGNGKTLNFGIRLINQ